MTYLARQNTRLISLDFERKIARRYIGRVCDMVLVLDGQPDTHDLNSILAMPRTFNDFPPQAA